MIRSTNSNKVALVVHTCDRYEFLYKGFWYFFNKYWDYHIPCNYYFATEDMNVSLEGFTNLKSGKGEWGKRLINILHAIPEEYVIYMQEDMWLSKKINRKFIEQVIELTITQNWEHVKLHSLNCYITTPTPYVIEGFEITKLKNNESDWLMCHELTLWKKTAMLRQLRNNENPWENEHYGTVRLKKQNPDIYQVDYFGGNGREANNTNCNPILRGEFWSVSKTGTLSQNCERFITILKQGTEEEKAYAAELEHHYIHKLTHDGKPRPKQRNLYKKVKHKMLKQINLLMSRFGS